ncbi:site-specific DNA-methyltransferase [Amycolatopsis sp. NPDC051372]|uniref:DNA-methyltransferase n=1 Tax=Amycolatopsis sp. NPDC051372 TaxID=3155669 RepID=UPI00343E0A96
MNSHPASAIHYRDSRTTLYVGDATTVLKRLPSGSVDCVVTSPPRWDSYTHETGARMDNHDHVRGGTTTPQRYVNGLVEVFAQLHRVLADTGTVWVNLGDSYSAGPPTRFGKSVHGNVPLGADGTSQPAAAVRHAGDATSHGAPARSLLGMPWRVAFRLQADGWILRNAIVWNRTDAHSEEVRESRWNRYQMVFLLAKQRRYFFNLDAIREPLVHSKAAAGDTGPSGKRRQIVSDTPARRGSSARSRGKNPGDVWSIPQPQICAVYPASLPVDLPLRCIAAGCQEEGVVLDPFSGVATTGLAAHQLGRSYIGIDLNPGLHDVGLDRFGLESDRTNWSAAA